MGLGKYLKKYKEYETNVLRNRVSAHRSRVAEKREYKTALKKSIESARSTLLR
jgi:hypothetical protein